MHAARNIELKARLADLDSARAIAGQLATQRVGTLHQIDTYFHCPRGRLKLREIEGESAQLIFYERADEACAKASDYRLVDVPQATALKELLRAALGVRVIVDKRRELYLYQNVRIHLDDVAELGSFLEFEAVLDSAVDDAKGHDQIEQLSREFGLTVGDRVAGSYADLMLAIKAVD